MQKSKYGILGISVGSVGLLLALVHFWAGPFSPQPSIESVVAEKAASIRAAAIDALKGTEPVQETATSTWDADKIASVMTAVLGGVAIILSVISFVKEEPKRASGGAVALGASAIGFQFIAMYAMAFLVVLLIAAALSSVGAA